MPGIELNGGFYSIHGFRHYAHHKLGIANANSKDIHNLLSNVRTRGIKARYYANVDTYNRQARLRKALKKRNINYRRVI